MLISPAYAQDNTQSMTLSDGAPVPLPDAPSSWELFGTNIAVVLVLVVLFYVLLIMPQQRRLREHSDMLKDLKKGDKVITGGGLVGTVDKIQDGKDEVVVDLGSGVKVTALRSTIHGKDDPRLRAGNPAPANDAKKSADKKTK